MECEDYPENGASVNVRCRGVKRRLCGVRLSAVLSPALARRAAGSPPAAAVAGSAATCPRAPSHPRARVRPLLHPAELPFMNEMDEITYWIYTKRAPCLMSYDELAKKRAQHPPAPKHPPVLVTHSISDETPTPVPKKKKRKLSLLDDDSDSGKGHENVYFDLSHQPPNHQTISSGKSSDIDFNIKKSSIKEKTKRSQKKNNNVTVHKKNKIVCSTPKGTGMLRRSLRNSRKSFHESNMLNSSYELLNINVVNGSKTKVYPAPCEQATSAEKKPIDNVTRGNEKLDQNISSTLGIEQVKTKTNVNGKFEDLSDVSGFTANYIRSTKIHSTKNGKKSKSNRSLLKESRQSLQKDPSKMVVSVNKSANTGLQNNTFDCSTDSSQNCLNLLTTDKNGPAKMSRCTSQLKFMDSKQSKSKQNIANFDVTGDSSKLSTSVQLRINGTSRYPRRSRNTAQHVNVAASPDTNRRDRSQNSKKGNKSTGLQDSPGTPMTRARSSRIVTPRQLDTAVLVLSASSEQVSSAVTMNVASSSANDNTPKNKTLRKTRNKHESTVKSKRRKKSMNKSEQSAGRDSLRDKSGFAACFSDSDDDKPLKPNRFFC